MVRYKALQSKTDCETIISEYEVPSEWENDSDNVLYECPVCEEVHWFRVLDMETYRKEAKSLLEAD